MSVYLIHFHKPYKHARHYLGFTNSDTDLDKRLTDHLCGLGARLMEVITDAGIEWRCVRVWFGANRKYERSLKSRKNASLLCPECSGRNALKRANDFPNGKFW